MSDVIRVLMRGDGRTVYLTAKGETKVRFDTLADRERFDVRCRLTELVAKEDVAGAVRVVLDAVNDGPFDDQDDLLSQLDDEEAREIITMEFQKLMEEVSSRMEAAIAEAWPIDPESPRP